MSANAIYIIKDRYKFFKFLAPCERMDYKEGDSWIEEHGFSKSEFRTAFAKIGKIYKSKKEYLSSPDPFAGKLYFSYYDRPERRTYYIRNHEKVDEVLDQWISRKSIKLTSGGEESQLPITEEYYRRLQQKTTAGDYAEDKGSNSDELIVPVQNTDKEIIDLFNLICSSLPKVQVISDQRKKAISCLWKKQLFFGKN